MAYVQLFWGPRGYLGPCQRSYFRTRSSYVVWRSHVWWGRGGCSDLFNANLADVGFFIFVQGLYPPPVREAEEDTQSL